MFAPSLRRFLVVAAATASVVSFPSLAADPKEGSTCDDDSDGGGGGNCSAPRERRGDVDVDSPDGGVTAKTGTSTTTTGTTTSECRLYLAESSIPGDVGFGVFTTVDLSVGDDVGFPDVSIQVVDLDANNAHLPPEEEFHPPLLTSHSWDPWTGGGIFESKERDVRSFMPHVATLYDYHPQLANTEPQRPIQSSSGVHRSRHPGAGAFTHFTEVRMKAVEPVQAGTEIFASYGEGWYLGDEVPTRRSYEEADRAVTALREYLDDPNVERSSITPELWTLVRKLASSNRTRAALPTSLEDDDDLRKLSEIGSARNGLVHPRRSRDWLEEHGICIDALYGAPSTVDGAGRGAFASRGFSEGDVITTTPLVTIPDVKYLALREMVYDPETRTRRLARKVEDGGDDEDIMSHQLLLNYCYGHPDSSMVLFPYAGLTSLINHNSEEPNAFIRWASDSEHHRAEWLDESVDTFRGRNHTGLFFEYVASRDISPHEEVFIDYGPSWERSWNDHVSNWTPPPGSEDYVPAFVLNGEDGDGGDDDGRTHGQHQAVVRTAEERVTDPYPPNVMIACLYCYGDHVDELDDEKMDPTPGNDEAAAAGSDDEEGEANGNADTSSSGNSRTTSLEDAIARAVTWSETDTCVRPCTVLARERGPPPTPPPNGEDDADSKSSVVNRNSFSDNGDDADEEKGEIDLYTAVMLNGPDQTDRIPKEYQPHVVKGIPRRALRFLDVPGSTDQHLPGAFRHAIGVPEGLWPEAWMNLRDVGQQ